MNATIKRSRKVSVNEVVKCPSTPKNTYSSAKNCLREKEVSENHRLKKTAVNTNLFANNPKDAKSFHHKILP